MKRHLKKLAVDAHAPPTFPLVPRRERISSPPRAMAGSLPTGVLKRISAELKELMSTPPEGITVLPNDCDITEITAVIAGPADTPFAEGQFKMKLKLGNDFPQAPPKGVFVTKIFHPNVSKTGEICVNTLKKDWKEDLGLKHLLLTIKCLLIVPNPESALNEEAGRLLLENYDEYFRRAQLLTKIHAKQELVPPKQPEVTPSNSEADISKENNDTSNASEQKQVAAAKPAVVAPAPKKPAAIDKKRSLKRL